MRSLIDDVDWDKGDGLVPAIVQHAVTGRVLMLGYMTVEALAQTTSSKLVTFYSRSRKCLWTKGETSGNTLELRGIEIDCDNDTLLVTATPNGPTCHTGSSSCFDTGPEQPGLGFIGQLESITRDRANEDPKDSYTASLLNAGVQRMSQKVGEEGVEVALAGLKGDREELIAESADLLFHLQVLLHQHNVSFADVVQQLDDRHHPKPA
ncbi:MAG: bifunctional phosphoribosyl-AMP cyclohydrolase/phosphoribosyl-ATP diphosphatase HisIE [Woeseiaceae bacterium]